MSNVSMINGYIGEPKGLTDEDIVKALECCKSFDDFRACYKCPALENGDCSKGNSYISDFILDNALDLINRLKADKEALINGQESLMKCIAKKKETIAELDIQLENSRAFNKKLMQDLHSYHDFNIDRIKRVKDIAFKEVAERLKKEATIDEDSTWWITNIDVDKVLKEMSITGKTDASVSLVDGHAENDKAFWEDTH